MCRKCVLLLLVSPLFLVMRCSSVWFDAACPLLFVVVCVGGFVVVCKLFLFVVCCNRLVGVKVCGLSSCLCFVLLSVGCRWLVLFVDVVCLWLCVIACYLLSIACFGLFVVDGICCVMFVA